MSTTHTVPSETETVSDKAGISLEFRDDGVAVLWIDVPGQALNTLGQEFPTQLRHACDRVENADKVRALVIASKKKDNFVAGADIKLLETIQSAAEGEALAQDAQRSLDRLESLTKPVIAAIHGTCLGGGLELALACHERFASDHPKTKLALPEVQLGLLPGSGGSQRLPRVVGVQTALDMILTGKQINARKAKKIGLIVDKVPEAILLDVAIKAALTKAKRPLSKKSKPWEAIKARLDADHLKEWALAENPLGRKVLFSEAKKQLLKKTQGNYPAPEKILEVIAVGLEQGIKKGLGAEARAFGELLVTKESKALISIFLGQTATKRDTGVEEKVEPAKLQKVGVLGAGLMGSGIAYVTSAKAGLPVRLRDKDDSGILRGLASIQKELKGKVRKKRMTKLEASEVMSRITATTAESGLADCQIVIEAVFEDLNLKKKVLSNIENTGRTDCIFASNTSSLPIAKIAEASKHPETVIGMHYFSPVQKMPLLEIIVTEKTAPWVTATCVELGKKQGKTVIVVKDGVGFYTTRVLAPFLNEAMYLLLEGYAIEAIDKALVKFGFPVGPLKLTDEVGIDVGNKVCKVMFDGFGSRMQPPPGLDKLIEEGRLGRKNGRGFYTYSEKKKDVDETVYTTLGVEPNRKKSKDARVAAERCVLAMVNEAALCFEEGILRNARDGDIGAVFGLGFPPFLGGPFRYVDQQGPKAIVERLEALEKEHGARFRPAPILKAMAENNGQRFFGPDAPKAGESSHRVTNGSHGTVTTWS